MAGFAPKAAVKMDSPADAQRAAWPAPDVMQFFACGWGLCTAMLLDPAALRQLARERCRQLVAFARERSAFYSEFYRGLDEDCSIELSALPVLTREMLMERFDDLVTDPAASRSAVEAFLADPQRIGAPFAHGCALWSSSGTSRHPGRFVHDAGALTIYDALQLFRFRGFASPTKWGYGPIRDGRFAMVAATGGHFAGESSVERMRRLAPWRQQDLRVFPLLQPLPELLAQLEQYRPTLLATYPTVAALLAREQRAGRLHLELAEVWTGGESLTQETRALLASAFGAKVREEYGASEFPSIAVGCEAGWLHVNCDWVAIEPVDAQHRPVAPGEVSSTALLTNFANHLQPLIRYDIGDSIVEHPGVCECGNRLPAIRVHGRADDVLELQAPDGGASVRLVPLALTTVFEEGAGVYDFQLAQCGSDRLRLRLGSCERAKAQAAQTALRAYLVQQGLRDTVIEIDPREPLRAGAGAKLRRVVREA